MNRMMNKHLLHTLLCITTLGSASAYAADRPVSLGLQEFVQQATSKDTTFEAILLEQLPLQYRRALLLPDSDFILSLKHQHNFNLDQDSSSPQTRLSLSKLFTSSGTDMTLSYSRSSSSLSGVEEASLELLVSQPIARNAFGKSYQLSDQVIGIENEISRYQIVEAYEDYLASLTSIYYSWYSAYENLRLGQASYQSSTKLMDNILARQKQNIALPIDVNKMKLSVLGKKENLMVLQEIYDRLSNLVNKSIRNQQAVVYTPVKPRSPGHDIQFKKDYQDFTDNSRTYRILRLLDKQGTLEVAKAADDLLPSTNLLLGYRLEGQDWNISNPDNIAFAGIELRWPINRSVDTAKYKIAEIERKKTALSNLNKYEELHTNLKNLHQQILREQKLIDISSTRIRLAEAILKDEAENYSFGKVSLNDYIDAVNRLDENRFSLTEHNVQLNRLMLEWLRLTDQLVTEEILDSKAH